MGTALGDFSAVSLKLGYLDSALLFGAVIAIPALGYWRLRWNSIFCFWFAYVATRPLGASFADWAGKPKTGGGLGFGDGTVTVTLGMAIFLLVAYLTASRRDVQSTDHSMRSIAPPARDDFAVAVVARPEGDQV